MNTAQAWLVYAMRHMGAAGRFGVVLAMAGLFFYIFAWAPLATRSTALAREAATLSERLRAAGDMTVEAVEAREAAEDPLTRFYRLFPRTLVAVTSLAKIYAHARARGLELERGEYRLVDDGAGRLIAYQADLPIKGSYVQIRQFLAAILADLPFVALEEVAFERRRISDASIEAKVRLTLYIARDA